MSSANFSLWKTISLRHKFVVVAVLFTGVLAGLIGFSAYSINGQRDFSAVTDLAGRQRMLSQKYAKEVILTGQGQATDHDGTMRLMRESLAAMTDGGSALINVESGQRVVIAAATGPDTRARLTEQAALLRQLEAEAGRYLALNATDGRRADKLREFLAVQVQVLQSADQAVKQFVRDTERHIGESILWQLLAGTAAALGGVLISWLISRQIVDPLAACAEAALEIAKGNLRLQPQTITSSDELGQLQHAFNDMLF
jgi:nitrate/nitrite-specific signal transduction histidine kinase